MLPRKVNLTLATNPAGLQLRLDGQPMATPLTFDERRRDRPQPRRAGSAGVGRHDLRVRVVVRRRRRDAQHLDAGRQHDLHGDVSRRHRRHRQRPVGDLLQQHRLHRHDGDARRSDRRLRLGRGLAGAGDRRRHVQRALDRPGPAAVHRHLHVLHGERRRRAAVGERTADRQQLDRSRADREQRHDRADRRAALRHPDGVLRERRRRDARGCCGAAPRCRRRSVPSVAALHRVVAVADADSRSTSSRRRRRCRPAISPTPASSSRIAATARPTAGTPTTPRRRAIATRRTPPISATTR